MTPFDALRRAVDAAGSQSELARRCDTYQPRVSRWMAAQRVQPEFVILVESATGVSRHDLRPDIYPRPETPNRRADDQDLGPWETGDYGNQTDILDYTGGAVL